MSRRAAAVGATLIALSAGLAVGHGRAGAADFTVEIKGKQVALRSTMSYGMSDDAIRTIADNLFESPGRVTFSNARLGDGLARARLIESIADGKIARGEDNFAITGVPFTDAEKAELAKGPGVIQVPLHPVGLGVFVSGPAVGGAPGFNTVHLTPDPANDDPFFKSYITTLGAPEELDGPSSELDATMMKLPWRNVTAMLSYTTGAQREDTWYNADLMALWGYTFDADTQAWKKNGTVDEFIQAAEGGVPRTSTRFEPSADNLYLQQAFDLMAPDLFAQSVFGPAVPSEQWLPVQPSLSRGLEQILALLALPEQPQLSKPPVGTLAPMPTWGLKGVRDLVPGKNLKLWVAELVNGAGEWVIPTSASITKAIAAGGDAPLHGLTHNVPGAYPLTWLESLYAPKTGLSIDETNALAAYIRYVVTDGQDIMRGDGDGVLTGAMVTQALAQANAIVDSNCTAADGVPVASTTSPYYPAAAVAPKLAKLGAQQVCGTKVAVVATTTTTTVAATTTTTTIAATTSTTAGTTTSATTAVQAGGTASGTTRTTQRPSSTRTTASSGNRTPAATTSTAPTAAGATTTVAAGSPTTTTVKGAAPTTTAPSTQVLGNDVQNASAKLPLGLPSSGRDGFDRLTTMLLGGVILFMLRRWFFLRRRVAP